MLNLRLVKREGGQLMMQSTYGFKGGLSFTLDRPQRRHLER